MATGHLAAEDQSDDATVHVLVDAAEGVRLDDEAGLFMDLAAQAGLDRLVEFEDAAGGLPAVVVAALDEQGVTVVVNDDAADADGVTRLLGVQWSRLSESNR